MIFEWAVMARAASEFVPQLMISVSFVFATGTTTSFVGSERNAYCNYGSFGAGESTQWRSSKSNNGMSHSLIPLENLVSIRFCNILTHILSTEQQQMFDRVLELQQKEYGPHDQRCYVTIDKIKIVKSRGTNFEQAVEELRRTFSMPDEDSIDQSPGKKEKRVSHEQTIQKTKNQKNKVIQVLTSIRKKKPASH